MYDDLTIRPIGYVNSPYKEKFAIPRQPGLVTAAKGSIVLSVDFNNSEALRGIEEFSHLWVVFVFHQTQSQGWKPLVRPPRLGGNKKTGVLATRSTFRPNPIGLSVVKLDSVEIQKQQGIIHISGLDLLDKTPVIDIKPYLPYSDNILDASAGFAQTAPKNEIHIEFSPLAKEQLTNVKAVSPELAAFIEQVLQQDPRPAYKHATLDDKIYGMLLSDYNIQWQFIAQNKILVLSVDVAPKKSELK